MLEFLFRGFFEWIYGLIVDIWGFIAGGLLDIMGLDLPTSSPTSPSWTTWPRC